MSRNVAASSCCTKNNINTYICTKNLSKDKHRNRGSGLCDDILPLVVEQHHRGLNGAPAQGIKEKRKHDTKMLNLIGNTARLNRIYFSKQKAVCSIIPGTH